MTVSPKREGSAAELARQIARGERSSVEVIDRAFDRIAAVQEGLNPFCFLYEEEARTLAGAADAAVAAGAPLPPLHGVPVAIKDFTPLAGKRTTRGSYALEHWVPERSPVIVQRLEAAGAIVVARTTTPEFAFSSFTESPLWVSPATPGIRRAPRAARRAAPQWRWRRVASRSRREPTWGVRSGSRRRCAEWSE